MEVWFIVTVSLCVAALLRSLINLLTPTKKSTHNLPPSPPVIPIIGNILWLFKSVNELMKSLRSLHAELGPIVTLYIGSCPITFIADRSIAHQAFIQNGVVCSDRPQARSEFSKILTSNQHTITSASGPTWRILRRNLASEMLHPSRTRAFSHARDWVLQILINRLKSESENGESFKVSEHFQHAMYSLLVLMCFGDKLDENQIKEIEYVQRTMLLNNDRFGVLNSWPNVTKIVLRKLWQEFLKLQKEKESVLIPLIRARQKVKLEHEVAKEDKNNNYVVSYVDTLLDLEFPDEKRKITEKEIMSLCSEFLDGGTDTTSTALEWIMANLVKYPYIQEKLFAEIKGVVGAGQAAVKEDDLQKMPYLKALILEGLRRHPPAHLLLQHVVSEDMVLDKYVIPKNGIINVTVAELGRDPKMWEDPMAFKPERFMSSDGSKVEAFDMTGSRGIKMMPFGVGRRMCPAYSPAMLHLEYFVANLVWSFEWKLKDGDDVDLSETAAFTVVMKNPLKTQISLRSK